VAGNFADTSRLDETMRGSDVVFHLIGTPDLQAAEEDPAPDAASHVRPMADFLHSAKRRGIGKVIFLSSGGSVYGRAETLPISERHPTRPISRFGRRYLLLEHCIRRHHQARGLDYTILRVGNAYGEGQPVDRPQGVIGVFLDRILRDEILDAWGDGSAVRDYIYAGDVARAAARAAKTRHEEKTFNIGTGTGTSLLQVIEQLGHAAGCSPRVRFLPGKPYNVPANVLDPTLAGKVLGWAPTVTFADGVARLVSHLRSREQSCAAL
jgi:UDP-glucose 4-epimerase